MPQTILDPQGNARLVPDDQVDAALAAGGKKALKFSDPKGQQRWIPADMADQATQAGGKPVTDATSQGFASSAYSASPLSIPEQVAGAIAHPIDTAQAIPGALKSEALRSIGKLKEAWNTPNNQPVQAVDRTLEAIPFVGAGIQKSNEQYAAGNVAGAYGTALGLGASLALPEAIKTYGKPVGTAVGRFPGAVGAGVDATKAELYPRAVLPAAEQTARDLAKALVVDKAAAPNFIKAATSEASTVVDYAKRANIPINSTIEFSKAAEGAANEIQQFYDKNVLAPNTKAVVSVPQAYGGTKVPGSVNSATIGDLDKRINQINAEVSPNNRKATAGATSSANASDADLIAEKRQLTDTLHKYLADATGTTPQDIADLRQRAGKLRTIADEANASANSTLRSAGSSEQGNGPNIFSRHGGIHRAMQELVGGPEVIGNRAIRRVVGGIEPSSPALPTVSTKPNFNQTRSLDDLLKIGKADQ